MTAWPLVFFFFYVLARLYPNLKRKEKRKKTPWTKTENMLFECKRFAAMLFTYEDDQNVKVFS